jgi:hypothetical protein
MAMWNTHPEAMKTEQDPGMMQSMEAHQEIPTEDGMVMPVREMRKRCRVQKLTAEHCQKTKKGHPAMQQWHGRKGNSFGELGPRKIVDGARS